MAMVRRDLIIPSAVPVSPCPAWRPLSRACRQMIQRAVTIAQNSGRRRQSKARLLVSGAARLHRNGTRAAGSQRCHARRAGQIPALRGMTQWTSGSSSGNATGASFGHETLEIGSIPRACRYGSEPGRFRPVEIPLIIQGIQPGAALQKWARALVWTKLQSLLRWRNSFARFVFAIRIEVHIS